MLIPVLVSTEKILFSFNYNFSWCQDRPETAVLKYLVPLSVLVKLFEINMFGKLGKKMGGFVAPGMPGMSGTKVKGGHGVHHVKSANGGDITVLGGMDPQTKKMLKSKNIQQSSLPTYQANAMRHGQAIPSSVPGGGGGSQGGLEQQIVANFDAYLKSIDSLSFPACISDMSTL